MEDEKCPFCETEFQYSIFALANNKGFHTIECNICGSFIISLSDIRNLKQLEEKYLEEKTQSIKHKFSSFVKEKNIQNKINPVILSTLEAYGKVINTTFTFEEILASFPESPTEKLDRILLNLFKKQPLPGQELVINLKRNIHPFLYSQNAVEAEFYLKALHSNHYLTFRADQVDANRYVSITPEGFNKIYELQTDNPEHSKNVFVALDFKHKDSYDKAIKPVLLNFGFNPICMLDIGGDSDNIDNKIIGGIRKSHFIIADLTNKNSGAYWEAGLGYGLGRPVILCCMEDKEKAKSEIVHFDLNHNTILFYTDFEDLKKQLVDWIEANGRIVIPKKRL